VRLYSLKGICEKRIVDGFDKGKESSTKRKARGSDAFGEHEMLWTKVRRRKGAPYLCQTTDRYATYANASAVPEDSWGCIEGFTQSLGTAGGRTRWLTAAQNADD
jgi:hypothetical protein